MKRSAVFVCLCLAGVALLTVYLLHVRRRLDAPANSVEASSPPPPVQANLPAPATVPSPASPVPAGAQSTSAPPARAARRLYFRYSGVDSHYGELAWIDLSKRDDLHYVDTMRCEVVYASGGKGICLSAERGVFTTYAASLFDARTFSVHGSFPLKGIPSRARVSIDGSLGAFTVFVSGHGYTTLDFSTQTLLVDMKSGRTIADLEQFEVRRGGAVIKAPDFNFWGVTFTPDARQFYATLSTAGQHLLIHGDIAARRAEVIHENVECPSLSPDARRVAYKKRLNVEGRILWQLHVLELATGHETALAEKRSIDDQLEWLDNREVLYSVPSAEDGSSPSTDVWAAPIDGAGAPRLFLRNAYSPAAARCQVAAACAAAH